MLSNDMMTIGAADASFYAILKLRIKLLLKLVWNSIDNEIIVEISLELWWSILYTLCNCNL